MNPYLSPATFRESLTADGPVLSFPVRIRVATGVAVTLIPLVVFGTNPALAIAHPKAAFLAAVATAFLLGLMPTGYGKSDGSMGLWILFVTVSFSMLVWQQSASEIHPVERTSAFVVCLCRVPLSCAFVVCLVVFGFGLGILLIGVYAIAQAISRRAAQTLARCCRRTDGHN